MNTKTRILAGCMAAVLVAVSTGCGKKDDSVVAADSPWYDLNKVKIGDQYNEDQDIANFDMYFIGKAGDNLLFSTMGVYKNRQDTGNVTADSFANSFSYIDVYSLDGTLVNSIDEQGFLLDNDLVDLSAEFVDMGYEIYVENDKLAYEFQGTRYLIDPATGEIEDQEPLEVTEAPGMEEGVCELGEYVVDIYSVYDYEDCSYYFDIHKDGAEDVTAEVPVEEFAFVDGFMYLGDGQAVFCVTDGGYTPDIYYSLDLTTGQVEEYTEDTGWFRDDLDQATYIEGVGNVVINPYGIRKLDFETQTKAEVLDFDCCNINRYDAMDLELLYMTDDTIIMAGNIYSANMNDGSLNLYVLERQDTNPNAGKKIITAATMDTFDYAVCEAVCAFNETDTDNFIKLDSQYSTVAKYANSELDYYSENSTEEYMASASELSNKLMVDLIAGEGPDIILNGASFTQLNSDDILLDLSEDISTEGLFNNVINAAKTGDKLYQFPLAVNVAGIVARAEDVPSGQVGFTFDQYAEFVSGPCNGQDPIGAGQLEFLTTAMSSICAQCVADGTANFDNEDFRTLALYANDNVFEEIILDEEITEDIDPYTGIQQNAEYIPDLSFYYLIDTYGDSVSDMRIMGFPTTDGKGPGLTVESSVAISAGTDREDACKDFVRTLISEDIQYDFGTYDGSTPVRISSFEQAANDVIDNYNDLYEMYSGMYSEVELRVLGLPSSQIDHGVVDDYRAMLESCTYINSTDPSIMVIVREEMASYFSGQKNLDEVISLIDDRAQTFLDERS